MHQLPLPQRRTKRLFNGPSSADSGGQTLLGNSGSFGPLTDSQGFSCVSEHDVRPPVALLHKWHCPSHIGRFVVSVRINAVNRMIGAGRGADVFEKLLERRLPFGANRDAPSTVIRERLVVRVQASPLEVAPSGILFGVRAPMGQKALCPGVGSRFLLNAAAAFRMAATKRPRLRGRCSAAITLTEPEPTAVRINSGRVDNSQSSESLTNQSLASLSGLTFYCNTRRVSLSGPHIDWSQKWPAA